MARTIVLICIGSMLLALVHIHYTNLFRQERESAKPSTTITTGDDKNESSKENVNIPTKPDTTTTPPTPPTTPPPPKTENNNDNALTTTIRHENGTYTKTFKPEFFKDATKARKALGSFLETLEHRTWWNSDSKEAALQPGTPITNAFFSYLPMGGGNNQFTSLQRAALLAKDLGRTLIIPPIAPSSHIKVKEEIVGGAKNVLGPDPCTTKCLIRK